MTKITAVGLALVLGAGFALGEISIKDGDQIAVLSGQGFPYAWSPSGYMRLLADELAKAGVKKAPWIFLDGQKTEQMLARLDSDVIAKKPVLALIIPGTRDYNAFAQRSVDESFTKNLEAIITKLEAAHIKTVLVTSYASNSDLAFSPNQNVGEHNDAIRVLAKAHGLTLIDFVKVVDAEKKLVPFDGSLAAKAVEGQMFAGEVLRSLGFREQEIAACRQAWLDTPGAIQLPPSVSANTYEKLKAGAKASGVEVGPYMTETLRNGLK
ncbi:MAG: GDSL-type esterase/lipase family protein [Verrucomicrobiae bacterium]